MLILELGIGPRRGTTPDTADAQLEVARRRPQHSAGQQPMDQARGGGGGGRYDQLGGGSASAGHS